MAPRQMDQLTRLTKWLCVIILVLVLVVLALVLLLNQSNSRAARAFRFQTGDAPAVSPEAIQGLPPPPPARGSPTRLKPAHPSAGRHLSTSASDDQYTFSTPHDSLDGPPDHDQDRDQDEPLDPDSDPDGGQANQLGGGGPQLRKSGQHVGGRPPTSGRNRFTGAGTRNKAAADQEDKICMTPGCVRAAAQILNNMDNSTSPCDDFYQFACGRWIQTQIIPDEKTSLSVFSQNTADLNLKLRALIERGAASNSVRGGGDGPPDGPHGGREEPPIVGQMRNMYASCMNTSDIEARGDEPLLEVLRDLGGWPVLSVRTLPPEPAKAAATRELRPDELASSLGAMLAAARPPANSTTEHSERRRRNGQQQQQRAGRTRARRQSAAAAAAEDNELAPPPPPTALANFSWLDTLVKFRQRGFSHDMIIDLSVVPDVRNSRRYIIELDQSSLGLPDRSYYFRPPDDSTVRAYLVQMVQAAVTLGAPRREAQRQMLEVFQFETQLANISVPREQRRNVSRLYNKMLARDLYQLAPNIEWDRYLRSLLRDKQLDLDRDEVIVKVPAFLTKLDALLRDTEPRVVANYMIWRIVRHSMSALGRKWREISHAYASVTTGRQVEEPRWEQCLGSIDNTLGTALSALYVKNHFNEASKERALEMVKYIRAEFLQILDEIDWMDEATREEARLKARGIATYIGYPDELLNDELVEELYAGVSMARTNFYQNVRNLRVWSTNYAFSHLRKPNKRGDWKKHAKAAVVNAYYNSLENSIEFPAGILQGAFFDADRPNYMNFGAIGYVIGHEITHGFDDRGRQFDRDGNDRNWWKPKTDAQFKVRAQCIIEQYGNYTLTEQNLRVNGLNTQGENIADNGGIKESFRAYQRWTKHRNAREPRLPGLDYSPDQLFWISAANIWCGKFRPEVLKLRINSGVHSPAKFRVVGPLSNSVEFAQSFNCPAGSPMNPRKKCAVW